MANTAFPNGLSVDGTVIATSANFTIGTEAANAITVNVQLVDGDGADLSHSVAVLWYLASDSAGDTVSAAPAGGIAAGTDGTLIEWTNNVSGVAISESDGDIDFVLTDATGAVTFYLVLIMPTGARVISNAITFA